MYKAKISKYRERNYLHSWQSGITREYDFQCSLTSLPVLSRYAVGMSEQLLSAHHHPA